MLKWLIAFLTLFLKDPRVPAGVALILLAAAGAAGGHLDDTTAKWFSELVVMYLGGLANRHRGLQDPVNVVAKANDTEGD